MPTRGFFRRALIPGVLLTAAGILIGLNWSWLSAYRQAFSSPQREEAEKVESDPLVELVPNRQDTVRIPAGLLATPRFQTAPVVCSPRPEPLRLPGTLILDPNRNAKVHSLFSGQVVKIGLKGVMAQTSLGLATTPDRGLRPGDEVKAGQVLAVIHSKDAGALKTDLVIQISKLRTDEIKLERYEKTERESPGAVPPNDLLAVRQSVEADRVAVANAERSLRSAQFSEEEIAVVKREADKLRDATAPRDQDLERTWAEYLVRAPFDGRIVQKDVTLGDAVDPTTDLFKIAKLDRLQVLANVYEEDLGKLQLIAEDAARAEAEKATSAGADTEESPGVRDVLRAQAQAAGDQVRAWTVCYQATGDAGEPGSFDKLGTVIDPMQHTGTLTGWVDNSRGRLFVGQFVTATVNLKPDPNLIAVPTPAVVETPDGPIVFVQTDAARHEFTRRKVAVVVRGREQVLLRRTPTPAEAAKGVEALGPSDAVLTRGSVEVYGALEALRADAKK